MCDGHDGSLDYVNRDQFESTRRHDRERPVLTLGISPEQDKQACG
jgi:hypothetical protein